MQPLPIRGVLVVPAGELSWSGVRASGPGGQNVNKVSSKVMLRFDFEHSSVLTASVKERLRARYQKRLDQDGCLVVTSQVSRDQSRNLADARARLAGILDCALRPPRRRIPTRPTLASKERRLSNKKQVSQKKQRREKPEPG